MSARFLVIRLSSIGDIVHALPAVAALGETGAEVHWAVETRYAVLLEGNPFVRRVLALDTLGRWIGRRVSVAVEDWVRGVAALREWEYDVAVDFQGLFKSALVARVSRSRERLGFADAWLREPLASIFYTDRIRADGRRHVIEMNLALAERLGARAAPWQFPLPKSERAEHEIESRLLTLGNPEFIIINPGGGWPAKRWPRHYYAELIRRLGLEFPYASLLTGSAAEEPDIEFIIEAAGSGHAHYFPSTLPEFIALARRARLLVSGDTGPMHLAAAVGTPIVAIFSSSDPLNTPERNGPFSPADITVVPSEPSSARRRGSGSNYMRGISVDSVLAAVRARLARSRE